MTRHNGTNNNTKLITIRLITIQLITQHRKKTKISLKTRNQSPLYTIKINDYNLNDGFCFVSGLAANTKSETNASLSLSFRSCTQPKCSQKSLRDEMI